MYTFIDGGYPGDRFRTGYRTSAAVSGSTVDRFGRNRVNAFGGAPAGVGGFGGAPGGLGGFGGVPGGYGGYGAPGGLGGFGATGLGGLGGFGGVPPKVRVIFIPQGGSAG